MNDIRTQSVSERPQRGYRGRGTRTVVNDGVDTTERALVSSDGPAESLPLPFARAVYDEPVATPNAGPSLAELQQDVRAIRVQLGRTTFHPSELRDEVARLRALVEGLEAAASAKAATPSTRLRRMLDATGIEGKAAAALARDVKAQKGDEGGFHAAYREAVAKRIRVRPWPLASHERQVIAVVGPPGVGKTTTVAKLAARALIEQHKRVALITCDTYRVGAIDHIWRYAGLLGLELVVARDANELRQAVAEADADLVLCDTAGRGPTDDVCAESALANLGDDRRSEPRERRVLLCLPAEARALDSEHLVRQFAACAPTEIVVTKLDLTRSPSGLLHGMFASGLAISTLCAGQRVPEDIQPATAGVILDHLNPKLP